MTGNGTKISVIGAGYVGMSLSVLLSTRYDVTLVELIADKVEKINKRLSPIKDKDIEEYLENKSLALIATTDIGDAKGSDFVIVATPTNYDSETNRFDTSSVESVVKTLRETSPESVIIIKSTIPIGYTEHKTSGERWDNVLFSPEFLREGHALYDNLHPSRIIVGVPGSDPSLMGKAEEFASMLRECSLEKDVPTMIIGSTEAESIKLFSNTYLAMRVSFFNELDTFSETNGLNSSDIIKGVCMDPRIGDYYNNPSFGYGGYCLPKDTKQLLSNYHDIPNSLIKAIVESNMVRKSFIAGRIEKLTGAGKTIGIYRLIMKKNSDNYRESSILDIIRILKRDGFRMILFEPTVSEAPEGITVCNDLGSFCRDSDIIITNRVDDSLRPYMDKVYTRDIFNSN